jgi:hypothetical protein
VCIDEVPNDRNSGSLVRCPTCVASCLPSGEALNLFVVISLGRAFHSYVASLLAASTSLHSTPLPLALVVADGANVKSMIPLVDSCTPLRLPLEDNDNRTPSFTALGACHVTNSHR